MLSIASLPHGYLRPIQTLVWSVRSEAPGHFFFSQRRLDLAFQFPFYRLTFYRLNKTDISVGGNGKKLLFLHNLISKPRMNPFRAAEDTSLSHFPRNQLNFKWGMRDKNRPEKPFFFITLISVPFQNKTSLIFHSPVCSKGSEGTQLDEWGDIQGMTVITGLFEMSSRIFVFCFFLMLK